MSDPSIPPVTVTIAPQVRNEAVSEQQDMAALIASVRSLSDVVQQMRQSMAEQDRQMAQLTQQRKGGSATARHSLSPPAVTPSPGGEYSASAALPRPPIVARKLDPRRQSFGQPSSPLSPVLTTPPAAARPIKAVRLQDDDTDGEADEQGAPYEHLEDGMPVYDKRLERVRKSITAIVKPFYGQSSKDTLNVIDWVEKVDTEFSIQMGKRQSGRLDIVRSLLAGTALKWMNRRVQELTERVEAGEMNVDIEWDTLRQPFIDAHLGINTADTFKAQLRALRLYSDLCPTPVELNKQFDHLAELAYPDRRAESMATVLGDEYRRIVAESNLAMYKNIEYNQAPVTIDEWKRALSRRWVAGKNVEATEAQLSSGKGGGYRRGAGRGRGGGATGNTSTHQPPAVAASVQGVDDDGAGPEGGERINDNTTDPQLSAAKTSRGARGQKGGRGRGGLAHMDAERQRLYDEQRCFNCKEVGHVRSHCPKPPTPKPVPQQSNESAGQQ